MLDAWGLQVSDNKFVKNKPPSPSPKNSGDLASKLQKQVLQI